MTMLEARNITMQRAGVTTLHVPALDIPAGTSLLVRGPSGCGKTTLLHILAGLLRPSTGDVAWRGQSYAAMGDDALDALRGRHYGFVFQQLHLIRHLRVADNIRLAAPKADIAPLLAALGIAGLEKKRVSDLSTGQAQRVAIARAVAHRPDVIFADEPTSALDDASAAAVIALLRAQAAENGASLIVATHDARISGGFDTTLHLENGSPTP